uniref:FHA domain-containing protein n=1 Tax=Parascaris equorum TaxID=6256 RepID=A0A914RP97_PAREQ
MTNKHMIDLNKEEVKVEKEKPSFEPSGKLAEDTNTYRGVVVKYNEPSDARKPKLRWRLYPFKYRLVPVDLDDGTTVKRIRPYIIDLGSANGTYLNGERIEPQ